MLAEKSCILNYNNLNVACLCKELSISFNLMYGCFLDIPLDTSEMATLRVLIAYILKVQCYFQGGDGQPTK